MAQDVYTTLLRRTRNLMQQLQMVALWRRFTNVVGNTQGVAKIDVLVREELGETGPLLLP